MPTIGHTIGPGRRFRWHSIGQVLAWYVRTKEALEGASSNARTFEQIEQYGGRISCGRQGNVELRRPGNEDAARGDVALIGACLPRAEEGEGEAAVEQAAVARMMVVLCCGGDRGDGMNRHEAAHCVRKAFRRKDDPEGERWTDDRCARLLQRAIWETRVRLQEKHILPRSWGG